MSATVLKRQMITDSMGHPVGVILPWAEFVRVEKYLAVQEIIFSEDEKLVQMEKAAHDPLFLADLEETMTAFAHVDTEGWGES
jgi:hypothetical protein